MKAKLDEFYTAAFDVDNKEVYAIEARPVGNRTYGTLRRYTYPDFRPAAGGSKFKIPHLGVRMAIDSKSGLLFVAAVPAPPPTLVQARFDNASASGDIAVYDLKLIREGKAADGKPLEDGAELKPVETLKLGKTIQGLELSADGKSLYVLTTVGVSVKKSQLLLVETEARPLKVAKTKDLSEPAQDMAKSADGKTLLIIEAVGKNKKSGVVFFDPAAWSVLRSATLDGATLDVAPQSGGGGVASVLPMTQPVRPGGPGGVGPGGPGGGIVGPGGPGGPGGVAPLPPPGGGVGPGGPGGGGPGAGGPNFKLHLFDSDAGTKEMDLGVNRPLANGGYVEYDPANKKLFISSYRSPGLDVYEVTDAAAASGVKLKASIRSARGNQVGGHFLVSPDGKFLLFHTGVVIDTDNVGGAPAGGGVGGNPGFPGPGGGIVPPGGPGGGVAPPMPPGPGGFVPPGMGGMPGLIPVAPNPGGGAPTPPGGPGKPPGPGGMPPGGVGGMPPGGLTPVTPGVGGGTPTPPGGPGKPPAPGGPMAPGGPGKPPGGAPMPPGGGPGGTSPIPD